MADESYSTHVMPWKNYKREGVNAIVNCDLKFMNMGSHIYAIYINGKIGWNLV
jgi:hypothetical protein